MVRKAVRVRSMGRDVPRRGLCAMITGIRIGAARVVVADDGHYRPDPAGQWAVTPHRAICEVPK